ncbi:pyridoxamine 5'-phosphate oxidase family protein [Rubrivivax gelatinosus]|nr:pyridoxamine 5'-phosphate oxidase family protein [Rubrivivax gelatinosus]
MSTTTPLRDRMRRSQREITERAEIDAVIRSARVMRIALVDGDRPFLVPVFYGYDGTALYFHSALKGSKIEILQRNPAICFEIGVDHGVIEDDKACDFEARHRTVIGHGRAVFLQDPGDRVRALDLIVANLTSRRFDYPEANLSMTAVLRIDIELLKGKQHGFGG